MYKKIGRGSNAGQVPKMIKIGDRLELMNCCKKLPALWTKLPAGRVSKLHGC